MIKSPILLEKSSLINCNWMHCPRTGKRNSDWELHLNMDSPTEKSSGRIKRGERKSLVSGCPLRFRSSPFSRAAFAPYSSSRQQKKGRDHKLELSSNYVNFFDRLSSFIAFSRLFSCIFFLFLIFLFNDNRVQNQAFDLKSCYFIGPKPSFFFIWAKKKKKFHMSKSVQGSKNDRKNDLCEWKRFA